MADGYTRPTGDAFRWPDVLDRWDYWEHTDPARKLPALLAPAPTRSGKAPCEYFDYDLRAAIYGAVAGVGDLDSLSAEDDCAIANIIDAVVAEQARRIGILDEDYFRRITPARRQYTPMGRYIGACDQRWQADIRMSLNGLIKRPV